jgi:hypothetical protein
MIKTAENSQIDCANIAEFFRKLPVKDQRCRACDWYQQG